jgi:hypothetical protein
MVNLPFNFRERKVAGKMPALPGPSFQVAESTTILRRLQKLMGVVHTCVDTTGFSRVVVQLQPTTGVSVSDTTGFSRVVVQFQPTTPAWLSDNTKAPVLG